MRQEASRVSVRVHQEHVGGAVAPAVRVLERVAEQRAPDRDDDELEVDRHDESASGQRRHPARRCSGHEMDDRRQRDALREQGDAADAVGPRVPPDEIRRKPGKAGGDGERRNPRAATPRQQPARHQGAGGHQLEERERRRGPRVRRDLPVARRDRLGAGADRNRDRGHQPATPR